MDYYLRHRSDYWAKPWSKRDTVIPRRTYSGRVVYSRPKHYFTVQDATRIMQKVSGGWDVERPSANALELAIASALSFWINALELFSWIDPWGIAGRLQVTAQEAIRRLVGVDNQQWNPWVVMDCIQTLASKTNRFDVLFQWRP